MGYAPKKRLKRAKWDFGLFSFFFRGKSLLFPDLYSPPPFQANDNDDDDDADKRDFSSACVSGVEMMAMHVGM